MERKFHILVDVDDVRIDTFLSEKLSLTRNKIKVLIEGGHVRSGNKPLKPSLKVKKSMEIEGELVSDEPLSLSPETIPLDIIYEDDWILAVNKPKGMVVHPSFGHYRGTLVHAMLGYLGEREGFEDTERPGIVHRLDKDTTGVILLAKDSKTQEILSRQFNHRSVEKVYRAVVEGVVKKEEGTVEGDIGRHPKERKRMAIVRKGGRYALSRYRVIQRLSDSSYVEVYPSTGRTHQIRVHLSSIGHPVVGDPIYSGKRRKQVERPLLHAYRISFDHPQSNKRIMLEAPIPDDIEEFLGSEPLQTKADG
ncbi:MAG TPA: RNA pseudouridine synthase [Deltaproteobacteria bacterium]|nr:RNA pseudouridine synthase [Deltaproteobacteria bacterium]